MDNILLSEDMTKSILEMAGSSGMPYGTKASFQFEILQEYIEEFQNELDSEHEVGMLLTCFGKSILLRVENITYENPVLLIFKGYVEDEKATLIQNVNQLNFLLTSVKKKTNCPKQKIGFITNPVQE